MLEAKGSRGAIKQLRSAAEARLAELEADGGEWPCALSHELELHRIELEMQNQSLQEMRIEAENAMARLSEINGHLEELVASRTLQLETARQKAELASRVKSRFLSNMSHELRTPLNAITGMTNLALSRAVDPEQIRQLEIVGRSLFVLHGVINSVLDISKIEAGKMALAEDVIHLNRIFEDLREIIAFSANQKSIQLVFELSPECAEIPLMGDSLRLSQILLNLAGNATKFTDQGSIQVRGMPVGRDASRMWVRFEVEDSGEGITEEDQERLFLPFEQLDGSVGRAHGGSGLGLAISMQLVTAMGGQIGVVSEVGKGSKFWFEVPLRIVTAASPCAAEPQDSAPEFVLKASRPGARVLVAEDDLINQEILRAMLRNSGLQVDFSADGRQAVQAAAAVRYDAVIMDIRMPEMDGLSAAREIRAMPGYQTTPIIALSADAFEEDRIKSFEAGMCAHLVKPVGRQLLFSTLLKWMVPGKA
jgi:signal transduction histidine kinase/ActR/RegA family two-component response regulator